MGDGGRCRSSSASRSSRDFCSTMVRRCGGKDTEWSGFLRGWPASERSDASPEITTIIIHAGRICESIWFLAMYSFVCHNLCRWSLRFLPKGHIMYCCQECRPQHIFSDFSFVVTLNVGWLGNFQMFCAEKKLKFQEKQKMFWTSLQEVVGSCRTVWESVGLYRPAPHWHPHSDWPLAFTWHTNLFSSLCGKWSEFN